MYSHVATSLLLDEITASLGSDFTVLSQPEEDMEIIPDLDQDKGGNGDYNPGDYKEGDGDPHPPKEDKKETSADASPPPIPPRRSK